MSGFHLSKEGREKVKRVGRYFKNKKISALYTSPLERAFETADIITDSLQNPPRIKHKYELTEVDARKWQSFPIDELFENKFFELFITDPETKEVEENLSAIANRMEKFTLYLCKKHQSEEIICVSHEISILVLRAKLEKKHLALIRNQYAETASITTFVFNEYCELEETNYTELK